MRARGPRRSRTPCDGDPWLRLEMPSEQDRSSGRWRTRTADLSRVKAALEPPEPSARRSSSDHRWILRMPSVRVGAALSPETPRSHRKPQPNVSDSQFGSGRGREMLVAASKGAWTKSARGQSKASGRRFLLITLREARDFVFAPVPHWNHPNCQSKMRSDACSSRTCWRPTPFPHSRTRRWTATPSGVPTRIQRPSGCQSAARPTQGTSDLPTSRRVPPSVS